LGLFLLFYFSFVNSLTFPSSFLAHTWFTPMLRRHQNSFYLPLCRGRSMWLLLWLARFTALLGRVILARSISSGKFKYWELLLPTSCVSTFGSTLYSHLKILLTGLLKRFTCHTHHTLHKKSHRLCCARGFT